MFQSLKQGVDGQFPDKKSLLLTKTINAIQTLCLFVQKYGTALLLLFASQAMSLKVVLMLTMLNRE